MNSTQKAQIIEAIKRDANLKGYYYDPKTGQACVIGGLALACEINKPYLALARGAIQYGTGPEKAIREMLHARFGLSIGQLVNLQKINDQEYSTERRRERLIELVQTYPTTD